MTSRLQLLPRLESGPYRLQPGFVRGRRQPSLLAHLRETGKTRDPQAYRTVAAKVADAWIEATGRVCPVPCDAPACDDWRAFVGWLGSHAVAMMESANIAVFDPVEVLTVPPSGDEGEAWSGLLLPSPPGSQSVSQHAWKATIELVNEAANTGDPRRMRELLGEAMQDLIALAPSGANTLHFLRAAFDLGIPVTPLAKDAFQYGQGTAARWLHSSLTDRTSAISTNMARSKSITAARLRQAGLPVPPHQFAGDAQDAVRVAERLGYPVVVKPADRDGSIGVAAGLDCPAEVRAAFEEARQHSSNILVEKHFAGRDYRLTVLDGDLLWAIERVPAGVSGDGRHSVARLIEMENADPRRGDDQQAALKLLKLDPEAMDLLTKQGLSPEAIPPQGQFVRLRRIASVASGGRPVAVKDMVHPDNSRLAIRAAEALRLDLAGIDLLIPDVARSWMETGAAICEVNAQPQFGSTTGPHLYGEILKRSLRGNGRIPVVVVVGAEPSSALAESIAARLQEAGCCVGWADKRGVAIGGEWLTSKAPDVFAAGQMILTNPRVDAAVLSIDDDEVLRLGLPCDRIDWLVLAGTHIRRRPKTGQSLRAALGAILASVIPACTGKVIRMSDAGILIDPSDYPGSAQFPPPLDRQEVVDLIGSETLRRAAGPTGG